MIGKGKGEVKWEVPVKGMFYFFILNYSLSINYGFITQYKTQKGDKYINIYFYKCNSTDNLLIFNQS
jgi:hypothetical protein